MLKTVYSEDPHTGYILVKDQIYPWNETGMQLDVGHTMSRCNVHDVTTSVIVLRPADFRILRGMPFPKTGDM